MRYIYLQGHELDGRMVFPLDKTERAINYRWAYTGEAPAWATDVPEFAFAAHNIDDRPRGREIRSMSVGDVVVVVDPDPEGLRAEVWFCEMDGWKNVRKLLAYGDLLRIAFEKGEGAVGSRDLLATT